MNKSIYLIALIAASFLFNKANAQVSVSFNIGVQPVWGPVGYNHVDYYYLPDIEAYYYVPQQQFIYEEQGAWITTVSLPTRYASFDLYQAHKVVINQPKPYLHHNTYKVKYISYKGKHGQHVIRDSHDSRYFEIKGHPEHSKWKAPKGNGGYQNPPAGNKQAPHKYEGQSHQKQNGGGHSQPKMQNQGHQKGKDHQKK